MAVLRLGVRPNLLIKNSIIASVTVLKPRDKQANKIMKKAAIGAYMVKHRTYNTILKRLISKLIISEGRGAALIQNPSGIQLL
jgi:hypothetical protein